MDLPGASDSQKLLDKGKGRAHNPNELTPLLLGQSSTQIVSGDAINRSGRLRSRLTFVFLISLFFCAAAFAFLAFFAWSYAAKASKISSDDIQGALTIRGPDRVNVLDVTSKGAIWLRVDVDVGVDAGSVMGFSSSPDDGNLWSNLWKAVGRWGIRKLDTVTVVLSTIEIISRHDPSITLASVDIPPLTVPLTANPPQDDSWLTQISSLVVIQPHNDTRQLFKFLRDSWRRGLIEVDAKIGQASIQGGERHERSWRNLLRQKLDHIRVTINLRVPSLPGLPHPGHNAPFPSVDDMITLRHFRLSSKPGHLDIHASATVIDPAPTTFNFTSPVIPFIVSLPNSSPSYPAIPVAAVSAAPFTLTHPNITLDISGKVLPLPKEATPLLSTFISRYLSKTSNPIIISSPLVANLSVETVFPAPYPPPRILRDVTIKDMKIKPGSTFLASGTVYARVVLPRGFDVDLVVSHVLPDVLIFDGEVSESAQMLPPESPLPDPLPEKAFGHIRPDDWLKSLSIRDDSDSGEGAAYIVTAEVIDVPLQVLPGRQKVFSNFVSKVVFGSDGAIAGILGTAAVVVKVDGLPSSGHSNGMELGGLPFKGSVRVGRKSLLVPEMFLSYFRDTLLDQPSGTIV